MLIRIVLSLGAIVALTFQIGAFSGQVSAPTETDPIAFVGSEANGTFSTASPGRSSEDKRSSCLQAHCHSEPVIGGMEMVSHLPSAKRHTAVLRDVNVETSIVDVDERPPNSRDL